MTELAVGEAFEKWGDDLVRYATVLVGADQAEDVVSQAVTNVMASGRWANVTEPRGYLFRATLNAARMMRRSETRRVAREWRTSPADYVEAELLSDPEVLAAFSLLSVQQRAVVYLAYWEDLDVTSIAQQLDITEGTIKRQLARARAKLRKVL